jgi:hypothetical protein
MGAKRRLNVTLYEICLSCLYFHRLLGLRTSKQFTGRPTTFRKKQDSEEYQSFKI